MRQQELRVRGKKMKDEDSLGDYAHDHGISLEIRKATSYVRSLVLEFDGNYIFLTMRRTYTVQHMVQKLKDKYGLLFAISLE